MRGGGGEGGGGSSEEDSEEEEEVEAGSEVDLWIGRGSVSEEEGEGRKLRMLQSESSLLPMLKLNMCVFFFS